MPRKWRWMLVLTLPGFTLFTVTPDPKHSVQNRRRHYYKSLGFGINSRIPSRLTLLLNLIQIKKQYQG